MFMGMKTIIQIYIAFALRHKLKTILLVLGISLGVCGTVAIDIAKISVSRSFELSMATLTARSTHQIKGSNFRIPESVFTTIRTTLGIYRSAPVIEAHVKVQEMDGKIFSLMGVDPFSEIHFRDLTLGRSAGSVPGSGIENAWFNDLIDGSSGPGILISGAVARKEGLKPGDPLTLTMGERQVRVTVQGMLDSDHSTTDQAYQGVILTDISIAQKILAMENTINRIDLILGENGHAKGIDVLENHIETLLPKGVVLVRTDRQNHAVRQLSRSFESSLTAFSMLALFMGIFLIYNTVSFSVTQRRQLFGKLRALGVTRFDIFKSLLLEILIIAVIGSALGAALGIVMGAAAVKAVCATVSDIYFVLTVSQVHVTWFTLFKGIAAGMGASLAASVFPALRGAGTQPVSLMKHSRPEETIHKMRPYLFGGGVAILGCALVLLTAQDPGPGFDFPAVFMIFIGASMLVPVLLSISVHVLTRAPAGFWPVSLKMGIRSIVRSLSRTSILVASLMVMISVFIGISVMTQSFRQCISDWIDGHIGGDVHISSTDELNRALDPGLVRQFSRLTNVSDISAYNIHRVFSKTSGEVHIFSYERDRSSKQWTWRAASEDRMDTLLNGGWIFVSEIFANANGLDQLEHSHLNVELETVKGPVTFRVAGIFRDFFMGGGRVVVSRDTMKTYWGYEDITSVQLFLEPDTAQDNRAVNQIIERIRQMARESDIPGGQFIRVISGKDIKAGILAVFENTFLITTALQILTAVVALTGILNAIMTMVMERSRQIGILRACGFQKHQTSLMLIMECSVCGLIAGILAIPLGSLLAWVLIHVVNRRSFGWTYEMIFSWEILAWAMLISILAAGLSGIFPAVRAGNIHIPDAMRME